MQKVGSASVPLVIYGVPFHNVTFDEAVEWIVDRVRSGRPAHIVTANLDFITKAWRDPELKRILIDADLVLADGFPIVKMAPLFGPRIKARVTGSDLVPLLASRAAQEEMSMYGLGGAEGVAEKAMKILKEQHPDLRVAGADSPPYTPLLEMNHREILQRLETAKPDILFVALGFPKQEKMISMHIRDWKVPVSIGVGGSLDFITGEQKRAPVGLQKMQMEWLWRVFHAPKRLFPRYLSNMRFLLSANWQMGRIRCMRDTPAIFQSLENAALGAEVERFQPLESEEAARNFVARMESVAAKNMVLDLYQASWLDSLELGALLEVNKRCRERGTRLILYALRPRVRRLLETCRLTDYFDTTTCIDEVSAEEK